LLFSLRSGFVQQSHPADPKTATAFFGRLICGVMWRNNKYGIRRFHMLEINKSIVVDENQKPIAVQIPIKEFERMEEVIENYGLAKLMDDVADDEQLSVQEAKHFYGSLKQDVES
jgi:hypothetical protein